MKKIIITKGMVASGKTSWANEQVEKNPESTVNICKDNLREMLNRGHYSSSNERFIVKARDLLIKEALRNQNIETIIISDTNLNPDNEKRIRELAGPDIPVEVIFFNTPIEECLRRNKARLESDPRAYVPEVAIRRMAKQWEAWKDFDCSVSFVEADHVEWNDNLFDAIIVDMDGTLALNKSGRSFYDYQKCGEDDLNEPVARLVRLFGKEGYEVIIMSGRDDNCYEITEDWLKRHDIPYSQLIMRKTGDQRKDSIIKRELFDAHIRGKFNVTFCVDDRNQVVDMYRQELGLTVLQANYGDF